MTAPAFHANEAFDDNGTPAAILVITADAYCLNLWIHHDEIDKIPGVILANWDERKSLQIGRSAGSKAFWCADATSASILIGHDDETWDLSITLPLPAIQQIYDVLTPLKAWLATTPHMPPTKYRKAEIP
jgi:hypothetical protein